MRQKRLSGTMPRTFVVPPTADRRCRTPVEYGTASIRPRRWHKRWQIGIGRLIAGDSRLVSTAANFPALRTVLVVEDNGRSSSTPSAARSFCTDIRHHRGISHRPYGKRTQTTPYPRHLRSSTPSADRQGYRVLPRRYGWQRHAWLPVERI